MVLCCGLGMVLVCYCSIAMALASFASAACVWCGLGCCFGNGRGLARSRANERVEPIVTAGAGLLLELCSGVGLRYRFDKG